MWCVHFAIISFVTPTPISMKQINSGPFVARFERYPGGTGTTVCMRVARLRPRSERPADEDVRLLLDGSEAHLWGKTSNTDKPWTHTIPPELGGQARLWSLRMLKDFPDDTAW